MTQNAVAPIAPDDRVSDVLARDESLVDVLVRRSSHFAKLRNAAMRRVMARLVTVEQAARIAGVPSDVLVRELNEALGIVVPAPSPAPPPPSPAAADRGEPAASVAASLHRPAAAAEVQLDVRADLRSGREPFSRIMEAVAELPPGAVLQLRAIFEPAPLFAVLARRGFAHESRCDADDDWSVWFWRPTEHGASHPVAPAPAAAGALPDAGAALSPEVTADRGEVVLDVRGLEPPEPLLRTLAALETLPDGYTLVQVNVRVPQFLIPMLGERGFVCEIDDSRADRVLVRIHRPR